MLDHCSIIIAHIKKNIKDTKKPVINFEIFFSAKKGILRDRKDFWSVLESIEKLVPEAGEITTSVREMPHIKYVHITNIKTNKK